MKQAELIDLSLYKERYTFREKLLFEYILAYYVNSTDPEITVEQVIRLYCRGFGWWVGALVFGKENFATFVKNLKEKMYRDKLWDTPAVQLLPLYKRGGTK